MRNYLFLLGTAVLFTACANEPQGSSDEKDAPADSTSTLHNSSMLPLERSVTVNGNA